MISPSGANLLHSGGGPRDHEARLAVEAWQRTASLQRRSAPRRSLEHQQAHIGSECVLKRKLGGENAHVGARGCWMEEGAEVGTEGAEVLSAEGARLVEVLVADDLDRLQPLRAVVRVRAEVEPVEVRAVLRGRC
jgi:hypothetical protein